MKKGLIINADVWELIDELDMEERNDLLSALSAYYQDKPAPDVCKVAKVVLKRVVLDNERFAQMSAARSEAGKKGMESRWSDNKEYQTITNDNKTYQTITSDSIREEKNREDKSREDKNRVEERKKEESREKQSGEGTCSRFVPPTIREVEDYAFEKGLNIDARRFVDFYESKGWMVGRSKMKDWKAAARNWAARDKKERLPFEDLDAGEGGFNIWEAV